jgi:hypothetical protein
LFLTALSELDFGASVWATQTDASGQHTQPEEQTVFHDFVSNVMFVNTDEELTFHIARPLFDCKWFPPQMQGVHEPMRPITHQITRSGWGKDSGIELRQHLLTSPQIRPQVSSHSP